MAAWMRLLLLVISIAGVAGCRTWQTALPEPKGKSPLRPIELASDGMKLEVLFARLPYGDPEINGPMWDLIDEQQVPPEVRRALAESGIRVGIVSGELPPALLQIVATIDQPRETQAPVSALAEAPLVSRQQMQLHSGWRGELVTSSTYPEMPLLVRRGDGVTGRTFKSAQSVLSVRAVAQGTRRVKLQFTPEVQHGQAEQQFVPEDGVFRPQAGKKKEVFDNLAFEIGLAPGQMLVFTTYPERPGTLGHYFFTETKNGHTQQKAVIVRLEQTKFTDLFSTPMIVDAPISDKLTVLR